MPSGHTEQEIPGNVERRHGTENKVDDGEAMPARTADARALTVTRTASWGRPCTISTHFSHLRLR